MVEDYGPVLRAEIRALPIELCGVVVFPKNIEQVFVRNLSGIVLDLDRFGVPGSIVANVFVGRILVIAAGIADACRTYTRNLAESCFNTPKASCSKRSFSHNDS